MHSSEWKRKEATKLLLEGKSCKTCSGYNDSPWDGAICLWYNQLLPKEGVCWDWSADLRRYGATKNVRGKRKNT